VINSQAHGACQTTPTLTDCDRSRPPTCLNWERAVRNSRRKSPFLIMDLSDHYGETAGSNPRTQPMARPLRSAGGSNARILAQRTFYERGGHNQLSVT
jgi:hypothetical protein